MQLDLTMSNIIIIYGFICVFLGFIMSSVLMVLDRLERTRHDKYIERKEKKNNDKQ